MFRVIANSDSGKTRKLLEECARNHGVFICAHPDRVVEKCNAYGINYNDIKAVYGYDNFDADGQVIYIDEMEKFLKYGLRLNVNGYSQTID